MGGSLGSAPGCELIPDRFLDRAGVKIQVLGQRIDGFAGTEPVRQLSRWNPRSGKNRSAKRDFRIDRDCSRLLPRFHRLASHISLVWGTDEREKPNDRRIVRISLDPPDMSLEELAEDPLPVLRYADQLTEMFNEDPDSVSVQIHREERMCVVRSDDTLPQVLDSSPNALERDVVVPQRTQDVQFGQIVEGK